MCRWRLWLFVPRAPLRKKPRFPCFITPARVQGSAVVLSGESATEQMEELHIV